MVSNQTGTVSVGFKWLLSRFVSAVDSGFDAF